jgi:hypothetical protein
MTPQSTNPKDIIGRSKPCMFFVPPGALLQVARVMELGASKYGPFNWRDKKVSWSAYYSAALRHLFAALDGEKADTESGMPHEAHAAACMAILLDAMATGNLVDDRPKPGCAAQLIKAMTKTK